MDKKYEDLAKGSQEAYACTNEQGMPFLMNTSFKLNKDSGGFPKWAAEIPFGSGASVYDLGVQPVLTNSVFSSCNNNHQREVDIAHLMANSLQADLNMHGSSTLMFDINNDEPRFKLIVSGHWVSNTVSNQ